MCVAGSTKADGACVSCAHGTYKTERGSTPCTDCPPPRNASRVGSVAPTNCSCRGGELDVDPAAVAVVTALGDLSDVQVREYEVHTWEEIDISDDTDTFHWQSIDFLSFTASYFQILMVSHNQERNPLTVFQCDSAADCAHQMSVTPRLELHGLRSKMSVNVTGTVKLTVRHYTGRETELAPPPGTGTTH